MLHYVQNYINLKWDLIFVQHVLKLLKTCLFIQVECNLNQTIWAKLQNTRPLYLHLMNKNGNYCYIPHSSKHTDTCKWSGWVFWSCSTICVILKGFFCTEILKERKILLSVFNWKLCSKILIPVSNVKYIFRFSFLFLFYYQCWETTQLLSFFLLFKASIEFLFNQSTWC